MGFTDLRLGGPDGWSLQSGDLFGLVDFIMSEYPLVD